ncbi:glycosyltransferase family 4 protein [Ruegeria sp. EL01]|jgi:glycosyltransferase involved in cell wall biosynthesis|uniref:glycosyltransferase family 4 protein n=1 Tax=Ruegeria sp. EL01 TaxID=2107578 RepID=UPI000EA7FB95|nr:glycosyltransferase family 4 protein [Ruegeria sp. EL01]
MPTIYSNAPLGNNPYQRMIYSRFAGYNVRVVRLNTFYAGEPPEVREGDIYWIHWETVEFGSPKNEVPITERFQKIEAGLSKLKQQGAKIVWTVHNFHPHNSARDMEAIHKGREILVRLADKIHVHTPYAKDLLAKTYGISADKLVRVAHPSYLGVYEPLDATMERRDVLPSANNRRFVHIGKVQENRGGRFMWKALKSLHLRDQSWELDITGAVIAGERRGQQAIREMSNVRFHDKYLPDDELSDIVASSHMCVAPFSRILTSGSVNLALTFGLPVIGPNVQALRDHLPEQVRHFLYVDGNPRGMMFQMRKAIDLDDVDLLAMKAACMDYAYGIRPEVQSEALRTALDVPVS